MNIKGYKEILNARESGYYFFLAFVVVLLLISLIISPDVSLYLGIGILTFVNLDLKIYRSCVALFLIVSGALMFASRATGLSLGDDFYHVYLPVINSLEMGSSVFQPYYSSGVEFILPIIFKTILSIYSVFFNNNPSEPDLLFIFTFSIAALYYVWMERFFLKNIEGNKSLCLAMGFLFLNFFVMGYMIRQAWSTIFILFALGYFSEGKINRAVLFSLLAIFTHLSAIPIIIIFYTYTYRDKLAKNIVLGIILFISLAFSFVRDYILSSGVLGVATYKMQFYDTDQSDAAHSFVYHFILLIFLAFFSLDEKYTKLKSLIIYGGISYFLLMPIPLASDRILMPFTSFMLGGVLFLCITKYQKLVQAIIFPYLIIRFLRFGPLHVFGGVYSDPYSVWYTYSWFGSVFFN